MAATTLPFDFQLETAPRLSSSDPGPRWGLLAIWAAFGIVAAGGLGASLALPNPASRHTAMPGVGNDVPFVEQRAPTADVLQARVTHLKQKLAVDSQDGDRWLLLARAHDLLGEYSAADAAYRLAAEYLTPDAALLADWAEAHLATRQRQWDDQARRLLKLALAADARHVKTLALAGSEAFDRWDYAMAIEFWQRMQTAAPAGSMEWRLAEVNIVAAKQQQAALH